MNKSMTTAEFIKIYHSLSAFQKEQIDKELQFYLSMNAAKNAMAPLHQETLQDKKCH